ncbi:hypothetical protein KP509_31G019500 [Ceratopteris richardii]|uniref:Uncharacterized protein n=1 Tax=Ceratopteris richardii TaxID=49495 RepID=A0A8T2QWN6_CERRI|nr:hypothetical protein KP509_31G019500 [Ceratopteris richardii]
MAYSGLLRSLSTPFAQVWRSILCRFTRNSRGSGSFAKLYHDVQTCAYEDVQVMWSILHQQFNQLEGSPGMAAQASGRVFSAAKLQHV